MINVVLSLQRLKWHGPLQHCGDHAIINEVIYFVNMVASILFRACKVNFQPSPTKRSEELMSHGDNTVTDSFGSVHCD